MCSCVLPFGIRNSQLFCTLILSCSCSTRSFCKVMSNVVFWSLGALIPECLYSFWVPVGPTGPRHGHRHGRLIACFLLSPPGSRPQYQFRSSRLTGFRGCAGSSAFSHRYRVSQVAASRCRSTSDPARLQLGSNCKNMAFICSSPSTQTCYDLLKPKYFGM